MAQLLHFVPGPAGQLKYALEAFLGLLRGLGGLPGRSFLGLDHRAAGALSRFLRLEDGPLHLGQGFGGRGRGEVWELSQLPPELSQVRANCDD